MDRKSKIIKFTTPSPLLLARTSRRIVNRSIDYADSTKILKEPTTKLKKINIFPLLFNLEPKIYQNHILHALRESLTVKKIEFSPPKASQSPNLSIPYRYKYNKPSLLVRENSYKLISKPKIKSKSISTKLQLKKAKKNESPQITPKKSTTIKRDYSPSKINVLVPPINRTIKPLPKVLLKEAMRNPAWLSKARPELDKMWRTFICKSNGIDPAANAAAQYKYYIGKGNNSRLVNKCFSSRTWWTEVDQMQEANFVWTQWKDKEFIDTLAVLQSPEATKAPTSNVPMSSPVNLMLEKNQYRAVEIEELGFQLIRNSASFTFLEPKELESSNSIIYNKLEFNQHLSNKKGLFKSLQKYCKSVNKNIFEYIPMTFHIKNGEFDEEFIKFVEEFQKIEADKLKNRLQNLWIIKPGENSNRGQGISLGNTLNQIKDLVSPKSEPLASEARTYIIQKYIEKPFLIHRRKFDIRCYAMITSINGVIQGYSYADGYLRTTSCEYNTKDISNTFIHLTNDAIQKNSDEYGKYEDGNKLSYKDFQRYLDFHCTDKKITFVNDIVPLIKSLIKDTILAVYLKIDPKKRLNCMEIFGYDFMLDSGLKPWLIEVNTNPCLELSSNYLTTLIPAMVENALRVAVDPLFPPPPGKHSFESFIENKFELIFHQETDGQDLLEKIPKEVYTDQELISDKEETYSEGEKD
jgi:tubulin polyglutamylase TTLL1